MDSEEHQYVVDSEGRIRPVDGTAWAASTWASAPSFEQALAGAGKLAISLARMENEPAWVGDLVVKQLLDIEDGASLVVGINTRRGRVSFSWGGEKFYPIRPKLGLLIIATDFAVRPLNRCEGEIKASFSAHRDAVSSLNRAIATGELEPTSIKPFKWWEGFWGVRGIAIRQDGYTPPAQFSIVTPNEAIVQEVPVNRPGPKPGLPTRKGMGGDIAGKILADDEKCPPRGHGWKTAVARLVREELQERGHDYSLSWVKKDIQPTLRDWERDNPDK